MDTIILYSQPTCGQCKLIHTLLDRKKVIYEECQDIERMQSLGINHTPTLEVNSNLLVGKEIFNYINGVC